MISVMSRLDKTQRVGVILAPRPRLTKMLPPFCRAHPIGPPPPTLRTATSAWSSRLCRSAPPPPRLERGLVWGDRCRRRHPGDGFDGVGRCTSEYLR